MAGHRHALHWLRAQRQPLPPTPPPLYPELGAIVAGMLVVDDRFFSPLFFGDDSSIAWELRDNYQGLAGLAEVP